MEEKPYQNMSATIHSENCIKQTGPQGNGTKSEECREPTGKIFCSLLGRKLSPEPQYRQSHKDLCHVPLHRDFFPGPARKGGIRNFRPLPGLSGRTFQETMTSPESFPLQAPLCLGPHADSLPSFPGTAQ